MSTKTALTGTVIVEVRSAEGKVIRPDRNMDHGKRRHPIALGQSALLLKVAGKVVKNEELLLVRQPS